MSTQKSLAEEVGGGGVFVCVCVGGARFRDFAISNFQNLGFSGHVNATRLELDQ